MYKRTATFVLLAGILLAISGAVTSDTVYAANGTSGNETVNDSHELTNFGSRDPHDLIYFGYRTVNTGGRGDLVFQKEPGGAFLSDYRYGDGSEIYVNLYWREKGYTLAYSNGTYGFVDAGYIIW